MRLYLSSFQLGLEPTAFTSLLGTNKHVAVIMNACDGCFSEERSLYLDQQMREMQALGLCPEELDLRAYFGKAPALEEALHLFGAVWVNGGNVFVLKRACEQSGFGSIVTARLVNDSIVYAGYSAGICLLAPTLAGLDLCDNPDVVPAGYTAAFSREGLGLVPYSLLPHFKSAHPEAALIDDIESYMKKNNLPYQVLRDGEAIVINGDQEQRVGRPLVV